MLEGVPDLCLTCFRGAGSMAQRGQKNMRSGQTLHGSQPATSLPGCHGQAERRHALSLGTHAGAFGLGMAPARSFRKLPSGYSETVRLAFFLLQCLFDGGGHFWAGRRRRRSPFGDDLAATIDEVLLEVPRDLAGYIAVGVGRKELVERTLILTLHRDLGEQLERDLPLLLAELLDFLVGSRLLITEVVGRKGENAETLVLVLLECRLQTGVL